MLQVGKLCPINFNTFECDNDKFDRVGHFVWSLMVNGGCCGTGGIVVVVVIIVVLLC